MPNEIKQAMLEHKQIRNQAKLKYKESAEFNQNHWKVIKWRKWHHSKVEKLMKALADDQLETLYYKYFQTSGYQHSVPQWPAKEHFLAKTYQRSNSSHSLNSVSPTPTEATLKFEDPPDYPPLIEDATPPPSPGPTTYPPCPRPLRLLSPDTVMYISPEKSPSAISEANIPDQSSTSTVGPILEPAFFLIPLKDDDDFTQFSPSSPASDFRSALATQLQWSQKL
jgi:hypothetical protein